MNILKICIFHYVPYNIYLYNLSRKDRILMPHKKIHQNKINFIKITQQIVVKQRERNLIFEYRFFSLFQCHSLYNDRKTTQTCINIQTFAELPELSGVLFLFQL